MAVNVHGVDAKEHRMARPAGGRVSNQEFPLGKRVGVLEELALLAIGVHVILGLPGEGREDMLATARQLARLPIHSVKLHNLYAVKDTPLAAAVAAGAVRLSGLDEYIGYAADFLEAIPPGCVVDRLCGDAPLEYLIAPEWCRDKSAVRAGIEAELVRRDSWQGARVESPESRVQSRESRVESPESRVQSRESRVESPE